MEVVGVLLLPIFVVIGVAVAPQRAQCPPGWWLGEGVRASGEYACHASLPRTCGEDGQPPCKQPARVRGRIYCTGGTRPIVHPDGRTVGCQRGVAAPEWKR